MKTLLSRIVFSLGVIGSLAFATSTSAQTVAITPSAAACAAAGGTITFTVTLSYTGAPSALGFSVVAPTNWTFGTTGGTNPPDVKPGAGDTGELDFAWVSIPASPASFTFTVNYPASVAGNQDFKAPTGIFRISGVATQAILPDVVLTSAAGTSRLVNISTRAQVGTGANILIPGFVVSGSGTETLLIRADGPGLAQFGVSGFLAQPSLSVTSQSTGNKIANNTAWGTNANAAQIASVASQVGAFALTSGSADCAIIVTLPAGAYTVQVSGVNNTTGVALAEVYEVSSSGARLANISTRAQVGTGGSIIIAGFVVSGSGTEQLLVRGDGPGLAQFGVTGALAQPSLSLINQGSGATIASNTVWGTGSNPAQVTSIGTKVGAFSLAAGSADSAVVANVPAGAYTAQVAGVNSTTGVALAEVYEVPSGP
jgi:hypothetical protein